MSDSPEKEDEKKRKGELKKAAALKYDGQNTPKVVAKGEGMMAEQIVEIAERHDVFIHQDPVLVNVLAQLELGEEIPENLYLAVAKIISFVYMLEEKIPDKFAP